MIVRSPVEVVLQMRTAFPLHVSVYDAHEIRSKVTDLTARNSIHLINCIQRVFLGKHTHLGFHFGIEFLSSAETTLDEPIQTSHYKIREPIALGNSSHSRLGTFL